VCVYARLSRFEAIATIVPNKIVRRALIPSAGISSDAGTDPMNPSGSTNRRHPYTHTSEITVERMIAVTFDLRGILSHAAMTIVEITDSDDITNGRTLGDAKWVTSPVRTS
jgi:hypothetical protein